MKKLIIGIIGKIHSGKSTLAKELTEKLQIPIVSFGGYLKEFSIENGLSTDRESLQTLGNKRISDDAILFINDVLFGHHNTNIIIIEGIRHHSVLKSLNKIYNQSYFIFLDVPFTERYKRYTNGYNPSTKNITIAEFDEIDNHEVESEINNLKKECNLIIGSDYSNTELFEILKEKLIQLKK